MVDQPSGDSATAEPAPEPRITVIGVGGAGGNAVNNMIRADLEGVEFVVANTDAQALGQSLCERQIQLDPNITQGLGAGSRPDVGRAAAEEAQDEILEALISSNMVFITAGMGGGTGTGGAPVIARAARDAGVLTVGVVTRPFQFEGAQRMRRAEAGIAELSQHVDTLIVIPNQNLFLVADKNTTFADAFKLADEVLHAGVRGVSDLMVLPGLVNLDFADIRTVMAAMGNAVMGTGEAEGDNRALEAAEAAISNPLLADVSVAGARNVLINITGGLDLTLYEVDAAANRIREEVDAEANIIFGSAFNENLNGKIRVSVVATGADVRKVNSSTSKETVKGTEEIPLQSEEKVSAEKSTPLRLVLPVLEDASSAGEDISIPAEPRPRQPMKPRFAKQPNTISQIKKPEKSKVRSAKEKSAQTYRQKMCYVVFEDEVGVRIYKVPLTKSALIYSEPHADKLTLFDSLEKAKAGALINSERITNARKALGLRCESVNPPEPDIMTLTESTVPNYFL